MARNKWIHGVWFVGLLWILADMGIPASGCHPHCDHHPPCDYPNLGSGCKCKRNYSNIWNWDIQNATHALKVNDNSSLFVAQNLSKALGNYSGLDSVIFLQKNHIWDENLQKKWPEINFSNSSYVQLKMSKWHTEKSFKICVLFGVNCSEAVNETTASGNCSQNYYGSDCKIIGVETNNVCNGATYAGNICNTSSQQTNDKYFVTINNANKSNCMNCNNPVKAPEMQVNLTNNVNVSTSMLPTSPDEPLNPTVATTVMDYMSTFASSFNGSSAALSMGESITGVLVKQKDPLDVNEVSFAYTKPNDSFNILDNRMALSQFSRSVTVSKEAFKKAMSLNITAPFAAVFRFLNMSKDKYNHSVLGDEVIAIEMGAAVKNLTDTININFLNMNYNGIPTCYSWNGNGRRPNWTDDGCETVTTKPNITCKCTHMTFFAILLTPLNETISSSDLNTLTTITRVGCGLSMFFLGIVLFMHFVMRKARASKSTLILIHLVLAMFLLDFTFLINDLVAKTKNSIGCILMAALMHYFMLTTFTWFAVHAFHLCMQLYTGGKIEINHYVLKVSITSWVLPSIVGIVLLSVGKYGEDIINTDKAENKVSMCWITDSNVHYIVNIGYYALVFLFTFCTFILMLTWLYCIKKAKTTEPDLGKGRRSGSSIVTITGLCCILGVTWGCAFFAYGAFRVPAYYIFTILNSFQGFCLFIYYYKTSHMGEAKGSQSTSNQSTSSVSTLKTDIDELFNPYDNIKQ